jgi:hypothetical protein
MHQVSKRRGIIVTNMEQADIIDYRHAAKTLQFEPCLGDIRIGEFLQIRAF